QKSEALSSSSPGHHQRMFAFPGSSGVTEIVISGGCVFLIDASCPLARCLNAGWSSMLGCIRFAVLAPAPYVDPGNDTPLEEMAPAASIMPNVFARFDNHH
ncbi:hypothetical protein I7I51_03016, partial [Histoplasma capsulatum]